MPSSDRWKRANTTARQSSTPGVTTLQRGPRPAPGPGENVTAAILSERWADMHTSNVVEFYGHGKSMGDWACFSNFFDQSRSPLMFSVPAELSAIEIPHDMKEVSCAFSEKAIMMCKAAVMGDLDNYMQVCAATSPGKAKALGRQVKNWNEEMWKTTVCSVGFHVVYQKFQQDPRLRQILLATGDRVIAETTSRDCNWGIGLDIGDPRARNPSQWQGTNILGWALMEAREMLRSGSGKGFVEVKECSQLQCTALERVERTHGRQPAVLMCHGSFNPVHRHHLEMMTAAKDCVEQAGFQVVRGLLAITPQRRLVRKGAEAVSDKHRLAALQCGCDAVSGEFGWLRPEPRGTEVGSGQQLVKLLRHDIVAEFPGAEIFMVVGADTAARYPGEVKDPERTVVVCREGADDATLRMQNGALLVEALSGEECSSTKLRAALLKQDEEAVHAMCPRLVADYLLAHRDGLWETACEGNSSGYRQEETRGKGKGSRSAQRWHKQHRQED